MFDRNNLKLGSLIIMVPESVALQEETEVDCFPYYAAVKLADQFQLSYDSHLLKGSYYLIVLNRNFLP
jgi:hypothetical protein